MRITQRDRIGKYMSDFGSITPMQAFADLGITKLSTRVGEMIADGAKIEKTLVVSKNRYGETVRYMRYSWRVEDAVA